MLKTHPSGQPCSRSVGSAFYGGALPCSNSHPVDLFPSTLKTHPFGPPRSGSADRAFYGGVLVLPLIP
ncbi:hypothetical protein SLEP1_g56736 [Rubroshorea leprosula]|uniref:Uncharacterized protein n=1 Tax=Rubroshorea leprosula TaxID=152421 RepID=A0AAV5MJ69_9ROSI|nr:hypothetical protein SLEP1_g56736 [Rubroshorea leprosula]